MRLLTRLNSEHVASLCFKGKEVESNGNFVQRLLSSNKDETPWLLFECVTTPLSSSILFCRKVEGKEKKRKTKQISLQCLCSRIWCGNRRAGLFIFFFFLFFFESGWTCRWRLPWNRKPSSSANSRACIPLSAKFIGAKRAATPPYSTREKD